MFDEVTRRRGGERAARRARYLVGSSAVQIGIVAALVAVSAAIPARVAHGPLVPVKIVNSAGSPRPSRAAPPPPPSRPKAAPKPERPARAKPREPLVMVQPKDVPAEPERPQPAEVEPPQAAEVEDDGAEEGTEGGAAGGVVSGVTGGAPGAGEPAGPVKFNLAMTAPVLVSAPPLEYTQQALDREIEGVMVVECVVTTDGFVRACRVLRSLPFMERAVIENLERRRYRPAKLDGRALDVQYTFTIRLRLPR